MKIPYYQVDAFTGSVFSGNPAGVCLIDEWLDDATLLAIAAENNLSETAFLVSDGERRQLRWFAPKMEIDLCGHATLAAAFVLFDYVETSLDEVSFETRSGPLAVSRAGDQLVMDFPSRPAAPQAAVPDGLARGLGAVPDEVLASARDYLVVFSDEAVVAALLPDFAALERLDRMGVIVTASGTRSDFVSRFFAPQAGVAEDPVTGSAHCTLTPYWSARLGRKDLHALQLSQRGGELFCQDQGDRVVIGGQAALYLQGWITI